MSTSTLKPGWQVWKFEQIAENINDRVDDPSEAGVDIYVGLEHLDSDSLKIRRWGTPDDITSTKLRFYEGDIIFGKRRVYQRKLGVAEFEGICSAHALVLRAKPKVVLPEFLPFFMQSDLFMERAKAISVGSLSPTINWKTLAKQEFALPGLEEQERSAEQLVAIDEVIGQLDHFCSTLLTTTKAIVSDVARQSTGSVRFSKEAPLANGWRLFKIREICSHVIDCLHRTPNYVHEGVPAIRTTDVNNGELNLLNALRVPAEEYEVQTSRLEPRAGDILYSREAPMGHAALVPEYTKLCISQRMMHLRCIPSINSTYVMEILNSQFVKDQVERFATGSTVKHVNVSDVRNLLIPIPNQAMQSYIADQCRTLRNTKPYLLKRMEKARDFKSSILFNFVYGTA